VCISDDSPVSLFSSRSATIVALFRDISFKFTPFIPRNFVSSQEDGPYDDLIGPVVMSTIFIIGLFLALGATLYTFFKSI